MDREISRRRETGQTGRIIAAENFSRRIAARYSARSHSDGEELEHCGDGFRAGWNRIDRLVKSHLLGARPGCDLRRRRAVRCFSEGFAEWRCYSGIGRIGNVPLGDGVVSGVMK